MTRVYRIELLIVDHDDIGPDEVSCVIENTNYPNDCIDPSVASIEEREVEWSDEHPLNKDATWLDTFRSLFGGGDPKGPR